MLMWWKSEMNFSFFLSLATSRMRSSARGMLVWLCAQGMVCWSAFPLVSALGSPGSAANASAADCSRSRVHRFVRRLHSYYDGVRLLVPVHHRLRLLAFPMRTVPLTQFPTANARPPSFRCDPFCT